MPQVGHVQKNWQASVGISARVCAPHSGQVIVAEVTTVAKHSAYCAHPSVFGASISGVGRRILSRMSDRTDRLEQAFAALGDGDVSGFRELFAPEAQWLGCSRTASAVMTRSAT